MKSLSTLLLFVGLALFSEVAASQGNPFGGSCFGACNGIILSDQNRLTQQQTENLQLQNEALRNQLIQQQLEQQRLAQQQLAQQRLMQQQFERQRELQDWEAANPWFGRDKAKTDFALQYARQLRAQQSPLTGRQFYDAVARKVAATFPPHQQKRK